MGTATALQSFVGVLSKDVYEPDSTVKDKQGNDVTVPGALKIKGKSIQVVRGQNFDDNHPAVLAFPTMFGLVEAIHHVEKATVEQATAAPGEKRGAK